MKISDETWTTVKISERAWETTVAALLSMLFTVPLDRERYDRVLDALEELTRHRKGTDR